MEPTECTCEEPLIEGPGSHVAEWCEDGESSGHMGSYCAMPMGTKDKTETGRCSWVEPRD